MQNEVDPTPLHNRERDKQKTQAHANHMQYLNLSIEMNENIIIKIGFKQVWWNLE